MAITPNGICRYLSNIPLDSQYTDTLTFGSASAQASYFSGHSVHSQSHCKPINVGANVVMCDTDADTIYKCNYIMFQNSNYGTKWFYAFITNIEWVNPDCCRVSFELDSFQSWLFDFDVQECFVVREHASSDTIGANIVPEPFSPTEYIIDSAVSHYGVGQGTANLSQIVIACATTEAPGPGESANVADGLFYGPIYSGLEYHTFSSAIDANAFLNRIPDPSTNVSFILMLPLGALPTGTDIPGAAITRNFNVPARPSALDGYTPKNKKLLTYPFTLLKASTPTGGLIEYAYEFFSDSTPTFSAAWRFSGAPTCYFYALNYKGLARDLSSTLTLSNYPQCAFTYSAYEQWIAYNQNSLTVTAASNVLNGAVSAATGNVGGTISAIENIASTAAKAVDMQNRVPITQGPTNMGGLFGAGINCATFSACTAPAELARTYDDYFTRFGYATNRVKVPNMTGRSVFNYAQTLDCTITGNIPFNDINNIKNAFNRGVTFWHGSVGANSVSNYSVDNYCLEERGEIDEYGEAKKAQRIQDVQ